MITRVEKKYFYGWKLTCQARGWKPNGPERHAMHRAALGEFKSHQQFTPADYDRVFTKMAELREPNNLAAVMEVLEYVNHDAAQAAHRPVVRPGKPRRSQQPPRRYASRYERLTAVDDPGERKRLLYVLERLFAPALVEKVFQNRFGEEWECNRDWRALPIPQLMELRDLLKMRLGAFITKVKKGRLENRFGFSLFNPETGRDFSNADIIAILLRRGVPVEMQEKGTGAALTAPAMQDNTGRPMTKPPGTDSLSTVHAMEVRFKRTCLSCVTSPQANSAAYRLLRHWAFETSRFWWLYQYLVR